MAIPKLTEDEIARHLAHLPGWVREGDAISRSYTFSSFVRALEFVNAIGGKAEEARHHPDMDIRYTHVTLALTTHEAGGLTLRDMEMAASADGAAHAAGGS